MRLLRFAILVILFLGGLAAILYGSLWHVATVEVEKTREISIAVPTLGGFAEPSSQHGGPPNAIPPQQPWNNGASPDDIDPFGGGNQPPGMENPFEQPAARQPAPSMKFETVTEAYVEASEEPEWAIVHEVTVGGVVRLANGRLKRTYTGKPPSLCPT